MGHRQRYAAKVDANQKEITGQLRDLGISVALGHDDMLLGYNKKTFWIELKDGKTCFKADGCTFKKGAVKEPQTIIRKTWMGHYSVCTSLEEILYEIGFNKVIKT